MQNAIPALKMWHYASSGAASMLHGDSLHLINSLKMNGLGYELGNPITPGPDAAMDVTRGSAANTSFPDKPKLTHPTKI
jgi:hypothetical protein